MTGLLARELEPLPPEDSNVVVIPMLTTSKAVDLFLGDFTRRSRSKNGKSTGDYRRILYKFADAMPQDEDVTKITPDHCRRFLDQFNHLSAGTQGTNYSIVNSFLEWLFDQERIKQNPLARVRRPKRIPAEDLDVTTVSALDVRRMLADAENVTEQLALAIPAYLGPRRNAVAALTLADYDRVEGRMRFYEKGSKTIWKPVPYELAAMLEAVIVPAEQAYENGVWDKRTSQWVDADGGALAPIPQHLRGNIALPGDYLVPPEGPLVRKGERDDRVIWRVVTRVAKRNGIKAHVHALRAAFATFYLESNTGDIEALRELMGHRSIQTTQTYLRRLDRKVAMERVRGLSWTGNTPGEVSPHFAGKLLASSSGMGAGGFEPPSAESRLVERPGTERGAK